MFFYQLNMFFFNLVDLCGRVKEPKESINTEVQAPQVYLSEYDTFFFKFTTTFNVPEKENEW